MNEKVVEDKFVEALRRAVEGANKIRDIMHERVNDIPDHNLQLGALVQFVTQVKKDLLEKNMCVCGRCTEAFIAHNWLEVLSDTIYCVDVGNKAEAEAALQKAQHVKAGGCLS